MREMVVDGSSTRPTGEGKEYGICLDCLGTVIPDEHDMSDANGTGYISLSFPHTVTHVDTSTGVLSEIKALSELVHRVSPETLVIVDGVCSVGSEEICFDEWGIDVVLTASQKAIGCPPGLSIMMCSERAIETFKNRNTPPSSYFASFKNWLPSTYPLHGPKFLISS